MAKKKNPAKHESWTVLLVRGTIDDSVEIDMDRLSRRLGVPVVACHSTTDKEARSNAVGIAPDEREDARAAIQDLRQMLHLPVPAGVHDMKSLRRWATTRLAILRTLVEKAERELGDNKWPEFAADKLSVTSAEYADCLSAISTDEDHPFDSTGMRDSRIHFT